MKNVKENTLRVIPVFFNVKVDDVKHQEGEFGGNFYGNNHRERTSIQQQEWKEALKSAPTMMALVLANFM